MRYSDDIIDEVRSKNDIVDIVSQYVKLKRAGSNYFGLCPFHNEKTPSFSVNQSKQFYHCFGCGVGGNVYQFLMDYENYSFSEALKYLADRAGVTLPAMEYSKEIKERQQKRNTILEINKDAAKFYYYQLRQERGKIALKYLTDRKLSDETMKNFGLGYAGQGSGALYKYLKEKGYGDDMLRESGLFSYDERHGMSDKFWNRVIFPIMDVGSKVIGFGGRVMGDGQPKYLNSPETAVFDKSRNLYGLHIARKTKEKALILCEGYMDVISMHQAGFTNAVASLGTSLTSGHASLLKRYSKEVLLIYDSDQAGIRAALRAIPILNDAGVTSRVVNLKPYKDPDEFIKAEGPEAFRDRLDQAMDSFLFRVDQACLECDMKVPQGQNQFFDRCAALLLGCPDELERNLYIEAIIKQYGRPYGVTADSLKKRLSALAMKGTNIEPKPEPRQVLRPLKKKDTAGEKAQKLILTWIVNYPSVFGTIRRYISPEDFVVPLYQEVAAQLFLQDAAGEINPARLLDHFTQDDAQREVTALFNEQIPLENEEEQNRAFWDALYLIKQESLDKKNRERDPSDMQSFQKIIEAKKELEAFKKIKNHQKIKFTE